jgi:hypothetical protein
MRKSTITILGACLLFIVTVVPVGAATDSTVHKNYERAVGYASGLDEGVLLSVYVKRVQNGETFRAPDDGGPYRYTSVEGFVSNYPYPNGVRCFATVDIPRSDAKFNFSMGHATLSFDSDCGPVEVVWKQVGELTVTQRNEATANGERLAHTQWFQDATMTATLDGLGVDDFSDGASLYRSHSMYQVES